MLEGKKQRGARWAGAGIPDPQSGPQPTSSPGSILHPGQTFLQAAFWQPLCPGGEFSHSSGVLGRAGDTRFHSSRPLEPSARTSPASPTASSYPGQELALANCGFAGIFWGEALFSRICISQKEGGTCEQFDALNPSEGME